MKKKLTPLYLLILAMSVIVWCENSFALEQIFYSDRGIADNTKVNTWGGSSSQFNGDCFELYGYRIYGMPNFDNNKCFFTYSGSYAGWGIFTYNDAAVNMSQFSGGYLKFWVNTNDNLKVEVKDTANHSKYISSYGWNSGLPNTWQEVVIPLSAFGVDLTKITGYFMITVESANKTFYIDYVRWTTTLTQTLQTIKVYPAQSTLVTNDQKTLTAMGYDQNNDLMPITPTWSVVAGNGTIISTINNTAVFKAGADSSVIIRASQNSISGEAKINIIPESRIINLTYSIYTDAGLPPGVEEIDVMPDPDTAGGPACAEMTTGDLNSGEPGNTKYWETTIQSALWGGWWIELPNPDDLKNFESGVLRFSAKSNKNLIVKLRTGTIESREKILTDYGWIADNTWRSVTIPLSQFAADGLDFSNMTIVFLASTFGKVAVASQFEMDYVRYEAGYSLPSPSKIVVSGRQLLINGIPFTIKGVCYSPTPVGEGYQYFDVSTHPEIYERDFRLIKAMGANTIRIYKAPTNIAFLDAVFNNGLYVIMDYQISYSADVSNAAQRTAIKNGFIAMVNAWKNHPAVLMWNLGNEKNTHLNGVAPSQWYSLVNECALAAHQAEGVEYHPVISANAETNEIGRSDYGADDASLPFMDAWAVQVYRGSSFENLFTDAASKTLKPIILTEFGCDAYDMYNNHEEQTQQASYLESQWTAIKGNLSETNASKICLGGTVFMWSDDWSKTQYGNPNSVHDTSAQWYDGRYYDKSANPNMNEEWWGICAIQPDTTDRTLRKVYFSLQTAWRTQPLMDAHINGGSALSWNTSAPQAGENVWKVADYPITIESSSSYNGDNFDIWGIRFYTDNTAVDANPRYTGDVSKGTYNLVAKTNTAFGLPLCWKAADATISGVAAPVWVPDRGDTEHTEGFTDYQWRWMKDKAQGISQNPFIPLESYEMVWSHEGIYWADHASSDADPKTPGNQPCPAYASTPIYVYVGLQLIHAYAIEYATNKLILEFVFP